MKHEKKAISMMPAGEILPKSVIKQTFIASNNYLSGISVLMANYARKNNCLVTFQLIQNQTAPEFNSPHLRTVTISALELYNNKNYEFFFDPIVDSKDISFTISIYSKNSSMGNAVTIWTEKNYGKDLGLTETLIDTNQRGTVKDYALRIIPRYSPPEAPHEVPTGLLLSPVTSCNYNCIHCISKDTRKRADVLPKEIAEKIKQYAHNDKIKQFASDYSGDLLFADEKYGGWLDYFISLNQPFHIDTNGSHLTATRISKIAKSNVRSINISVDSATAENFKRIRRGPMGFKDIVHNVTLLNQKLIKEGRNDIKISFGFTLMKSNLHEIALLIKIASEIGIKHIQGRHLEVYQSELSEESLYFNQQLFNDWKIIALELARSFDIELALPDAFEDIPEASGHYHCRAPWFSSVILGNGDVMACCIPGTLMGSLKSESLEQIWNGSNYRQLRSTVNSLNAPTICKSCPIHRYTQNKSSYVIPPNKTELGTNWVYVS